MEVDYEELFDVILEKLAKNGDISTLDGTQITYELAVILGYIHLWKVPVPEELTVLPVPECLAALDMVESNLQALLSWVSPDDDILLPLLSKTIFTARMHVCLAFEAINISLAHQTEEVKRELVHQELLTAKYLKILRLADSFDAIVAANKRHPLNRGIKILTPQLAVWKKQLPAAHSKIWPDWLVQFDSTSYDMKQSAQENILLGSFLKKK